MHIRRWSQPSGFVALVVLALVVSGCSSDSDGPVTTAFPETTVVPPTATTVVPPETTPTTVVPPDTTFTPDVTVPEGIDPAVVASEDDWIDASFGSAETATLSESWLASYGMVGGDSLLDRKDRPFWFAPDEACTYLPTGLLAIGTDAEIALVTSLARDALGVDLIAESVSIDARAEIELGLTRLLLNDDQRGLVDPYSLVNELKRNPDFPADLGLDVEHVSFTAQRYMFGPGSEPIYRPMTVVEQFDQRYLSPNTDVFVAVVDTGYGPQSSTTRPTGYDGHLLPPNNEDESAPGPRDNLVRADGSVPLGVFGHGDVVASIINERSSATLVWARAGVNAPQEVDLIQAVVLAIAEASTASGKGANVPLIINLSLGTYACNGQPPMALSALVDEIVTDYPRTVIIAAAGNDHVVAPWYPAGFADDYPDRVVSVGALASSSGDLLIDPAGKAAGFSNYGCVTTWAPGVDVPASQWHGSLISAWSGTSMSTAVVSGVIADRVEKLVGGGNSGDPVAVLAQMKDDAKIGNRGCGPH